MSSLVAQARYLLAQRTPLAVDCGRVCARACCAGGDACGMRLFPGEEELLEDMEERWNCIQTADGGTLLVCHGHCNRAKRPLACRLFPLFPYLDARSGRIRAVYDPRAWRICPLVREQRRVALDRDFVRSVRTVGRLIAQEEEGRRFLLAQAEEIDEYNRFLRLDAERGPVCRRLAGNRVRKKGRLP